MYLPRCSQWLVKMTPDEVLWVGRSLGDHENGYGMLHEHVA